MKGRSNAVPEWQESKTAVRRTPGRKGLTLQNALAIELMYMNYCSIHYVMHVIVYDMPGDFVIDRVNYIVESCLLC
jgi:hypothetical protein